ncbi:hypothetical protein TELCIR_12178, partial [Teladorsagia circumcincta]
MLAEEADLETRQHCKLWRRRAAQPLGGEPQRMLVSISWMTFWLDPRASPARITLTITSLLTLTTMSNGARQDLPQGSATGYTVKCRYRSRDGGPDDEKGRDSPSANDDDDLQDEDRTRNDDATEYPFA